jgi:hypothetical protein
MSIDFSGTYLIEEIFSIGPIVSIDNRPGYLVGDDCRVVGKKLSEDCVILHLKREPDGMEGTSDVKVQPQFMTRKDLLSKLFNNKEIMEKTLDELRKVKITI